MEVNLDIKEIQSIELNILRTFIDICTRYHLRYFLVGGSLLGAVRHHGFIPWDDDIDVGMLRQDYERFLQIAQQEFNGSPLFLQTPYTDKNYAFAFAKILDLRYDIKERMNYNEAQNGIFIDIFPFDQIPESSWARTKQVMRFKWTTMQLLLKLKYRPYESHHKLGGVSYKKQEEALQLKANRDWQMQRFNDVRAPKSTLCKNLSSQYNYDKELITTAALEQLQPMQFEDMQVMVPKSYDEILRNLYGDYLKLPPVSERISKHLTLVKRHDYVKSVDLLKRSQYVSDNSKSVNE